MYYMQRTTVHEIFGLDNNDLHLVSILTVRLSAS